MAAAGSELRTEIMTNGGATRADVTTLRAEVKADIAAVRTELKAEIAAVRAELTAQPNAIMLRLGGLMVVLGGIIIAALRYLPPSPMPIRRELRCLYPPHWRELSRRIRFERADGRC